MLNDLQSTISKLTADGKGILAADESTPTITKRLAAVGVESKKILDATIVNYYSQLLELKNILQVSFFLKKH